MSVAETVLVFAGIPLGTVALLAVLVYGPSVSRAPRYRPGRAWDHDPVWYVPHAITPEGGHSERAALSPGQERPALAAGTGEAAPASVLDAPTRTARGGAHGSW